MSSVPILNWKTLTQANRVAVALRWERTLESNTHLIKDGDITRLPIDREEPYMVVAAEPVDFRNGSAMRCEIRINGWRDIVTVDIPIDLYLSLPMMEKASCPECDGRNLTEDESRCYDCSAHDYVHE
jgi:hypothetical protein